MFAMVNEISYFDLLRIAAGTILVLALVVVVLVRILKSDSRRNRRDDGLRDE
jgi:hypothetical protein